MQKPSRTLHLPGEPNLFNEVIKLLNDRRLDQLTRGDISNLGQSMNFLEAGWLKALFFVYFHSFSQISSQDFIQSKTDSIKLQFLI